LYQHAPVIASEAKQSFLAGISYLGIAASLALVGEIASLRSQ
jgi:hypothetical protein